MYHGCALGLGIKEVVQKHLRVAVRGQNKVSESQESKIHFGGSPHIKCFEDEDSKVIKDKKSSQ